MTIADIIAAIKSQSSIPITDLRDLVTAVDVLAASILHGNDNLNQALTHLDSACDELDMMCETPAGPLEEGSTGSTFEPYDLWRDDRDAGLDL
jgi:hypothetical protein